MARERTRRSVTDCGQRSAVMNAPVQILTDNGKVFTGRFNHPPVEVLSSMRSAARTGSSTC